MASPNIFAYLFKRKAQKNLEKRDILRILWYNMKDTNDIFYYPGMLFPMGTRTYRETGSRNKKTGKLNEYDVTIGKKNKGTCTCPAMTYRPYQECKHVKNLKRKLSL